MRPDIVFATYIFPDPPPVEASELLGRELTSAWSDAVDLGPGRIPVVIGATGDGLWLAGLLMFLETIEPPASERLSISSGAEHVASIRLLQVDRQHRNAGLAGFLLRRALRIAAEQRCDRIRTTANFGCTDHVLMYERLGYSRAGIGDRPYLYAKKVSPPISPAD